METKANFVLIGAFTLAGFFGLLAFLMWFAKIQLDRQFAYYDIYFSSVSGLSISSEVQFSGLPVGRVINMELSDTGDGTVRTRIEVAEDTPVRIDSRASIEPQGVTGIANVAITAGLSSQPLLRARSESEVPVIVANRSVLETLTDQGPQMIERLNEVASQLTVLLGDENQARVVNILDNVERSSGNLDRTMADVARATEAIGTAAISISDFGDKIEAISGAAETTLGNIDKTLANVDSAVLNADRTLSAAQVTMEGVKSYIATDLTGLTQRLDSTAASLQTDLSALGTRAGKSLDALDHALEIGTVTLGSAQRAFEGAEQMLNTDLGPVIGDLRLTLTNLNEAIARVIADLPEITGLVRDAAGQADQAFATLRGMLDSTRAPVQAFARDGLPQFTRLAQDMRELVKSADQFFTTLRRNPAHILSGPQTPEFRR